MSTQTRASDIQFITDEAAQQFVTSSFVQQHVAGDQPVRIVPWSLVNRSNERIARADQWTIVRRVLFDPAMLEHLRTKGISILLMPEQGWKLASMGIADMPVAPESWDATHHFNVEFRSLTRAGSTASQGLSDTRKDLFLAVFELREAASGIVVWAGQVELARTGYGLLID